VHHFAWRLLRDDAAAVGATRDALTAAFRRSILDDDVTDLETLTFRCAFEAGEARPEPAQGTPGAVANGALVVGRRSGGPEEGAARQRFEAALESLEPRQRAALLLHDLQGMDAARSGEVLGLGAEAAGALLFRAREEFRATLHARPGYVSDRRCRQAEEALAGAVGLGMDQNGLTRLRRHAGYCRPCRKVMKSWTAANVGLAAVLMPPLLPEALAAAPVFGDVVDGLVPGAGQSRGGIPLPVARVARALKGRAAAWVLAAACLALAAGLVVNGLGLRQSVLMQSVGPAIRLIVAPPADGSEPAAARGAGRDTTASAGPTIGISGSSAPSSTTTISAGSAQPGARTDDATSSGDTPSGGDETARPTPTPDPTATSSSAGSQTDGDEVAGDGEVDDDKVYGPEAWDSGRPHKRASGDEHRRTSGRQHDGDGRSHGRASAKHDGAGRSHDGASGNKHGSASGSKHGRASGSKHGRASGRQQDRGGHGRGRDSGGQRDNGGHRDNGGQGHGRDSGGSHGHDGDKHDRGGKKDH
jgi:DNA-directed RNA polymerase specialized sigma24 family protein